MKKFFILFSLFISLATSAIAQTIIVTSPNGGENWQVGTTKTITWSYSGVTTARLEYTTDNGGTWTAIADTPAILQTYNWTIPLALPYSTQAKIRISDATNPLVFDESNATFTLTSLRILSPNGGENWQIGSNKIITWTNSSNVLNVRLQYSLNDGTTWTTITDTVASAGSYNWYIPPAITPSTVARIKIIDLGDVSINDISDNQFILSSLKVTSPNGGENWQAGTTKTITWQSSTNIANVRIQYSTDNGGSWNLVADTTASLQTYNWVIPFSINASTNAKIKIYDLAEPTIFDISDAVFTISKLRVISPNGGENWQAGTVKAITWQNSNNISNVRLEYSLNNGLNWTQIKDTLASIGTYNWNIPAAITPSTIAKIRISDINDLTILDASDNVFTISSLKVTSPNGGERWQLGTTRQITWQNSSNITNVRIQYSTDDGTNWTLIKDTLASAGAYNWIIPNSLTPSTTSKIRILDVADLSILDVSDSVFTLTKLEISSPVGGERWQAGRVKPITWINSPDIVNVRLQYTTNNGISWSNIADTSALLGTYSWLIPPNISSTSAKIKILNLSDNNVNDVSDSAFTISILKIISPNGGENWQAGTTKNISWQNSLDISNIRIQFSTNNGLSWNLIKDTLASITNYSWLIPTGITPSASSKIRILNLADTLISDESDTVFTIANLKLTSPDGGENWQAGTVKTITWQNSSDILNIRLQYTTNNGTSWTNISDTLASIGSYSWRIPSNISSTTARIKILNVNDLSINDISDSVFTISLLRVTSPNGGENWQAGTIKNITWQRSSNITNVRIQYTTDNGVSWNNIADTLASLGSYSWLIPAGITPSTTSKIKIYDLSDITISDESDTVFTIANLKLTSPDGGENWQAGTVKTITWQNSNDIQNVRLQYTTNNGTSWTNISDTLASIGSYSWRIPSNISSTTARIKILNVNDLSINDISDSVFTISLLRVTSPNGGENWQAGTIKNITWQRSSNITNVRIQYTTDNGVSWNNIADTLASLGSYSWLIPAGITPSTTSKIKIYDLSDITISDESDTVFTIANLKLTSPNGGENWQAGTVKTITWQNSSDILNVRLQYTTNNGVTWINIKDTTAITTNYDWIIPPGIASVNSKVKIFNIADSTVSDISDSVFTISNLKVLTPNGNERWQAGTTKIISWQNSSNITKVRIQYSVDNGLNYLPIADTLATPSQFNWNIPSTISPSVIAKIRVVDFYNATIYDESDSAFTLTNLKLTSPNGGENWQAGTSKQITWQTSPDIQKVKIYYSLNNGASYLLIADTVNALLGGYMWNIPSGISSSIAKVKINSVSDSTISDVSDSLFKITNLTVTSPNGGQYWQAGTTKQITWQNSNDIINIRIQYSSDNGVNWNQIKDTIAAPKFYNWTIPSGMSPSTISKIKITDINDLSIFDESDSTFTISGLKVISPNGGEIWQAGSIRQINWQSSVDIDSVKIQYSTNSGTSWVQITDTIATGGLYNWHIPSTVVTTNAKIKILKLKDQSILDISDSTFTISNLKLTQPNGGQVWQSGSTKQIIWQCSGDIQNVRIQYTTDNGATWNPIKDTLAAPKTYNWKIPNDISSLSAKIKILNVADTSNYDESDNVFIISLLKVTSPNGGETWKNGSTQQITWTNSSDVQNVRIKYSTNNGSVWINIKDTIAAAGFYNWTIPQSILSTTMKIKIYNLPDTTIYDVSDSSFIISGIPRITISQKYQSGTIKFNFDASTPGEILSLVKLEYQLPNNAFADGTSYLDKAYTNLISPRVDSIKWKSQVPLSEFEGRIKFKFTFTSSYLVEYLIDVDTVGIDNKAPTIDSTKFVLLQNPYSYGWDKLKLSWPKATDSSGYVKYSIAVSNTGDFSTSTVYSTLLDTFMISDLYNSKQYYIKFAVTDKFGNSQYFVYPLKTLAVGDINNDKKINSIDLAAFILAWTVKDSLLGADYYPFVDTIPTIRVVGNQNLELEDLVVFVKQWNWYQTYGNLPKLADYSSFFTNDVERHLIKFKQGENKLNLPINLNPELNIIALSSEIYYNNKRFDFDSLNVIKENLPSSTICLSHQDSSDGRINIDLGDLSGKLENDYIINASINCLFDKKNSKDSLLVIYRGYDKSLNEIYSKKVVYTLQEVPATFALYQNYPNPFNPTTTIEYDLPNRLHVNLSVYDILGQQVVTLINSEQDEGYYKISFNASAKGLASGVYLYRIKAGDYVVTKKMMLLK